LSASTFELTSESGEHVAVEPRTDLVDAFELVPEHDLEPSTRYVLKVMPAVGAALELSFTTGTERSAPPAEPSVRLLRYRFNQPEESSCSPSRAADCLSFSPDVPLLVKTRFPGGYDSSFLDLATESRFMAGNMECYVFQSRAPSGALSDPLELCRADFPELELVGSEDIACTEDGLMQDGALVKSSTPASPSESPNAAGDDSVAGSEHDAGDVVSQLPASSFDEPSSDESAAETSSGCALAAVPGSLGQSSFVLAGLALGLGVARRRRR
jgi:hypothetical protein